MKKNRILIYPLVIMGVLFFLTFSCKKDETSNNNNNNPVEDIDGNVYHTVVIGTQTWMVENLKTTRYRNGDPIPNITDDTEWENLTSGAYCDYENSPGNSTTYGRLYNWFAVNDNRNIAPTGWHVPTDAEWTILTTYLGGEEVAGGKLKETGTTHWSSPDTGATNESGFTCLPAGYRYTIGIFTYLGDGATFWSSTEYNGSTSWYRSIEVDYNDVYRDYDGPKSHGCSIRCLKDN